MANLNINEFVQENLPVLEDFEFQDPWWLLIAFIPAILVFFHLLKKNKVADLRWRNKLVRDSSVIANRAWPRRLISAIMILTMIALVYPTATPVNSTIQAQEKALLVWVYDASESMTTTDVVQDDVVISRLEASVAALEDSLETIPSDFYKLLISFADADEVNVGLPTLNSEELLAQANNIPRGEKTATDFGLERAVSACRQFFNSQDNYPCEIFLLSDGECNPRPICRIRSEEIAAEATTKGIVIHTISWGDPESDYRPNPEDMQAIADIGKGQHLSSVKTSELAELYGNVAAGMEVRETHQYLSMQYVWTARALLVILAIAFWLRRFE